jgi:hypothetical protein
MLATFLDIFYDYSSIIALDQADYCAINIFWARLAASIGLFEAASYGA